MSIMEMGLRLIPLPTPTSTIEAFDVFYPIPELRRFAGLCAEAQRLVSIRPPTGIQLQSAERVTSCCGPFYFDFELEDAVDVCTEYQMSAILEREVLAKRSGAPLNSASIRDVLWWHKQIGSLDHVSTPPIENYYANLQTLDLFSPAARMIAFECARLGFQGQKWRILGSDLNDSASFDRAIMVLCGLRESVGAEHRLMVDSQRTWTEVQMARFVGELPEGLVDWIEDAPLPEAVSKLAGRWCHSQVPAFASGEAWQSLAKFDHEISNGRYSIFQPDAFVCGGISAMISIAEKCSDASVQFAPHGRSLVEAMIASHVAKVRNATLYEFNPILEPLRQIPFQRKCVDLIDFR